MTIAPNETPVADAQTVTTDEGAPVAIALTGSDSDGDVDFYFTIVAGPSNGVLSPSSTNRLKKPTVTYTPNTPFCGDDSFTFMVEDAKADSVPGKVSITVNSLEDNDNCNWNEAPVADNEAPGNPLCYCDTLSHGMTSAADGKDACMKWHKTNPFLSAIKEPADGLPAPEGPDARGFQIECIWPDKNVKTGAAAEFEKGWEGSCPPDWTKCTFVHQKPEWQAGCGGAGCECHIYRNGAHPVRNAAHMCVTTYTTEQKDGRMTKQNVCTPPANGYEARFGESMMNW